MLATVPPVPDVLRFLAPGPKSAAIPEGCDWSSVQGARGDKTIK